MRAAVTGFISSSPVVSVWALKNGTLTPKNRFSKKRDNPPGLYQAGWRVFFLYPLQRPDKIKNVFILLGAARLFALRPVGIHHRVSAAGLFTRRCALLYHHPRPTGRAEQPGRAMFQALRCCFHPQAASFCLPPAAEARQQRQGRERGRRWGARSLGPGWVQGRGAWPCAPSLLGARPPSSARPHHERAPSLSRPLPLVQSLRGLQASPPGAPELPTTSRDQRAGRR